MQADSGTGSTPWATLIYPWKSVTICLQGAHTMIMSSMRQESSFNARDSGNANFGQCQWALTRRIPMGVPTNGV